ncbi:hypothetical protein CO154_01870 [Candidatus Pacearchaeota archaeon CG_4_9_14_3_um_filter_31_7]|nr:MAG: hypothetical protein AUJ10_00815 [Candidatus Pacearchaeota archaeon CG1_02_31_27]PIN92356.1 MAG: hypothetical protein COU55_00925 [Candidatus Pacearchaeota archaeon CG10_big_fil_rev_8_21_14_0_10_31_59]PIZ80658.1 MAG: hypothetical protein COX99_01955 [Candidatus Pacearchaeota archaeon CG_4_10_14_0_2_um_filter_31_10]PJA70637.1 MAG: hypothetical protein CO154_01870 [Candidatus Pacearchaeota archaeon CG_4_9_14_3_um_filter_31_7]
MNFIKEIFIGNQKNAHEQFIRFSRGVFGAKAVINLTKTSKIKITSTYELANDLVYLIFDLEDKAKIEGKILTKEPITSILKESKINFSEKKSSKGINEYVIDSEIDKKLIEKIKDKIYYFLVNVTSKDITLKIKQTLPKPSTKSEGKVNDKFCVFEADLKYWNVIKNDFFFDIPDAKKVRIVHKYEIKDIIIPAELKNEKDFLKVRLGAQRKGTMTRVVDINGEKKETKKDFCC